MLTKEQHISQAEWEIMRIVWTLTETTTQQILEIMHKKSDWSDSTIKTLVSRLVKKGFLAKDETKRPQVLRPLIPELPTMTTQAINLFESFCAHCNGDILKEVVETIPLSKADLAELTTVINEKLVTAPNHIQCNCLGDAHEK